MKGYFIQKNVRALRRLSLLSVGFLLVISVISYRTQSHLSTSVSEIKPRPIIDSPLDFGYKMIWFAVKTGDSKRLAEILQLRGIAPCGWSDGIRQAYNDKVFITPRIGQWTLAAGWGLLCPDLKNSNDELSCYKEKLNRLSTTFGEAQLFVTYRVNEYHCWAKSINGKIERLYFFLGETGENIAVEGMATPVEVTLNLGNTLSAEAKRDTNYMTRSDITFPDETVVMKIAENWSVDPTQLSKRKDVSTGPGLIGTGSPVTK